MCKFVIVVILASFGCPLALQAQKQLYSVGSEPGGSSYWGRMTGIGDVDGDGFGDLALRYIRKDPVLGFGVAHLEVWSGKNGKVLLSLPMTVHSIAAVGDVNKDGHDDIVVGIEGYNPYPTLPGRVSLLSGKDGSVIFTRAASNPLDPYFGRYCSGGGDVNNDGYLDYIGSGRTYSIVFSGKDGSILYRIDDFQANESHGWKAWVLGDLNRDGHADFAVSAVNSNFGGLNSGSVYVYSGKDRSLFYRLDGRGSHMFFGSCLAVLGDVDKDGIVDFAVGSTNSPKFGSSYSGYVEIFSGKDGRSLFFMEGENGADRFGYEIAGLGDTNRDGIPDFMTYSGPPNIPYWGPDRVVVLSACGRLLKSYATSDPKSYNIYENFAGLGDVDGDGLGDLALGWNNFKTNYSWIEAHAPFGTLPLQSGKTKLSLSQGESLQFQLDGGLPLANHWYALLGSMSGTKPGLRIGVAYLPLQPDLYFHLSMGLAGGVHQRPLGLLDGRGRMTSAFKLDPRFPSELVGVKLNHAFLGFSLTPPWIFFGSNAVETEIVR